MSVDDLCQAKTGNTNPSLPSKHSTISGHPRFHLLILNLQVSDLLRNQCRVKNTSVLSYINQERRKEEETGKETGKGE